MRLFQKQIYTSSTYKNESSFGVFVAPHRIAHSYAQCLACIFVFFPSSFFAANSHLPLLHTNAGKLIVAKQHKAKVNNNGEKKFTGGNSRTKLNPRTHNTKYIYSWKRRVYSHKNLSSRTHNIVHRFSFSFSTLCSFLFVKIQTIVLYLCVCFCSLLCFVAVAVVWICVFDLKHHQPT